MASFTSEPRQGACREDRFLRGQGRDDFVGARHAVLMESIAPIRTANDVLLTLINS